MDLHSDMMMTSSFLSLSLLAVDTCLASDCVLIASMNSFPGVTYHNPELLLLREAISPSFYM